VGLKKGFNLVSFLNRFQWRLTKTEYPSIRVFYYISLPMPAGAKVSVLLDLAFIFKGMSQFYSFLRHLIIRKLFFEIFIIIIYFFSATEPVTYTVPSYVYCGL
jgi:hypothetical protein